MQLWQVWLNPFLKVSNETNRCFSFKVPPKYIFSIKSWYTARIRITMYLLLPIGRLANHCISSEQVRTVYRQQLKGVYTISKWTQGYIWVYKTLQNVKDKNFGSYKSWVEGNTKSLLTSMREFQGLHKLTHNNATLY